MQMLRFPRWAALVPTTLLLGSIGLSACGGGGGGGSDEEYVAAVCSAMSTFQEDFFEAFSNVEDAEDEDAFLDALIEPFEQLVDDLQDANPPSDVSDYHEQVVSAFRDELDSLRDGNVDSLFEGDADTPEPPQDVQDRLQAAAADTPECEGMGLFEG